jgi:nucleoside-diphosphate-sugar epimerase
VRRVHMPITASRSELGALLSSQGTPGTTHFNIAGQQANTLLHDGHAWRGFARTALAGARRALRTDADLLVHASFAFVHGCPDKDPLRSIAQTILECESLVLAGPVPACVVRLGYLYGPESRDLLAYRKAFRIGRPYWAGPRMALQHHLHLHDAVNALVKAARVRNAGKVFYATDGTPVAFSQFMDDFARRVGNPLPLHVPRIATALIKFVVREEHMQQVALEMPAPTPVPSVPGWKPRYADYREGLDQTLVAWGP